MFESMKMIDRILLIGCAILIIIFINIVIGSRIDQLFERIDHEDEYKYEPHIEGNQEGSKESNQLSMQDVDCNSEQSS